MSDAPETAEQPALTMIRDPLDPTARAMMRAIVLAESFQASNERTIAALTTQVETLQSSNRALMDENVRLKAESGKTVARLREAGTASA